MSDAVQGASVCGLAGRKAKRDPQKETFVPLPRQRIVRVNVARGTEKTPGPAGVAFALGEKVDGGAVACSRTPSVAAAAETVAAGERIGDAMVTNAGADDLAGGRRPPRRRAVLIGINYYRTPAELCGCVEDVRNMRKLLVGTFSWPEGSIRTLTDDAEVRGAMPTRANILTALQWLVDDAQDGDTLFFHFSGHGAQQRDPEGLEEDGMNETMLPVDFQRSGMITDDFLSSIVVRPLPEGVRLTAVMDCCHSGTGLDLPFSLSRSSTWREETNPYHSRCDARLFSGCADHETSADCSGVCGGPPGGAMTTAFCDVLRAHAVSGAEKPLSHAELLAQLRRMMSQRGCGQCPQLTATQRLNVSCPFRLEGAVPNGNVKLGRIRRRRFAPRPRQVDGPLAGMLSDAGLGVVAGVMVCDAVTGLLGYAFSE